MTNDKIAKMVQEHYNQMKNTIELLENAKFATLIIPPKLITKNKKKSTISWDNQIIREGINAKVFSSTTSYQTVLLNRSFQILLFDNSIIRCSLEFEDDILITQNFSWIPCPLSIDSYHTSIELEPELISEEIVEEKYPKDRLMMRSPVRFDYDSQNNTPEHPGSHIHFQNSETRINTGQPVCFNTFVKHIIETYYPESYYVKKNIVPEEVYRKLSTQNWNGLSFKTISKGKKDIKYLSRTEYTVEILPMG